MSTTPTRVPIPPSDQTWLHMDRDNNLMHVHSLMWYAGEPSFAAVRGIIEDRVIGRFPVFRRRPVEVDGQWMWEDDPDFDIKHHLRQGRSCVARVAWTSCATTCPSGSRPASPPVGRCGTWR